MWSLKQTLVCASLATAAWCSSVAHPPQPYQQPFHEVSTGPYTFIYNASTNEPDLWYINDHTFIQDTNGTWHLFGITHPEPADPTDEHQFAHATAPHLLGPWTKQPPALTLDPSYGETVLWAPYVIHVNGTYYMFYCGGGADLTAYEINLATSTDLFHWTRRPAGPLFTDGYAARDPMVARVGNQWVLYYCGTSTPAGGHHVVMYRTSDDLENWSERQFAFVDPTTGTGGGVTESPFVYQYEGLWYLFIGPRPSQQVYIGTDVFVSDNPFHWEIDNRVRHIGSHALELVPTKDDGFYVSHCGWGQGGVYLAKLHWH